MRHFALCCSCATGLALAVLQATAARAADAGWPPPFYSMDTAFQRPGLSTDEQLTLVERLGFAGIAWHEEKPAQVAALLKQLDARGLKLFAIYCPASVTAEGGLTHSATLMQLMETLQNRQTIVWLHFGGKGPAIDSLTGREPLVCKLRSIADTARSHGLRVAIYPHFGEWTASFRDATRLAHLVDHPSFGVTFNLCHSLAGGEETEIPALLQEAGDVLTNVTICGADRGVRGANWPRLIQTLDKGTFDLVTLLRNLKDIGFRGPIGFQGYGIRSDAHSILTPTMRRWRDLVAATGQ